MKSRAPMETSNTTTAPPTTNPFTSGALRRFLLEGAGWRQIIEAHSAKQAMDFFRGFLAGSEGIFIQVKSIREIGDLEYSQFLLNGMPGPSVPGYHH